MSTDMKKDQWVWVVVQAPDGDAQFLGMQDDKEGVSFIPAFLEKAAAQQGLAHLPVKKEMKYEVQAIRLDDLSDRAVQKGFRVFILKGSGEVIEKIESH